jgi:hypothetical protein
LNWIWLFLKTTQLLLFSFSRLIDSLSLGARTRQSRDVVPGEWTEKSEPLYPGSYEEKMIKKPLPEGNGWRCSTTKIKLSGGKR